MWNLSRNPPRTRRQACGASLALSSPFAAHPGWFAGPRFSKSAQQPDRRPDWQESRQHKVAPVGSRSARMGQTVHRRYGRKLTYKTKYNTGVWMPDTQQTEQEARTSEGPAASDAVRPEGQAARPESEAPKAERPERKPAPQGDRPQGVRGSGPQGGGQGQRREA